MAVNNSAWIEKKRKGKNQRLYNCSLMWLVFVYQMYWCQNGQLRTMVTNCWNCKPKINWRLNKWKKGHVNHMRPNIKKNSTLITTHNWRIGGGFCPQYILTYIWLIHTLLFIRVAENNSSTLWTRINEKILPLFSICWRFSGNDC